MKPEQRIKKLKRLYFATFSLYNEVCETEKELQAPGPDAFALAVYLGQVKSALIVAGKHLNNAVLAVMASAEYNDTKTPAL